MTNSQTSQLSIYRREQNPPQAENGLIALAEYAAAYLIHGSVHTMIYFPR